MDSQQAKEILALHRPGIDDPTEPQLRDALEQTKRDAELARWFENRCAVQKAIRSKFKEIPLPPGLKERILAGHKIVAVPFWRRPAFLAAAASIVLMISLSSFWFKPNEEASFSAYRERMVRTALRGYNMDMLTNNLAGIRQYLQSQEAHGDYLLTRGLENLPGEGCAVLRFYDKPVSLICFDAGDENDLYLFIINHSDLRDTPSAAKPQYKKVNKLMTASWTAGNKTYLLAGPGDENSLNRFLF